MHRVLSRFYKIQELLDKYEFLNSLQDRNETLFYKILIDNIERMGTPKIVYFQIELLTPPTSTHRVHAHSRCCVHQVQFVVPPCSRYVLDRKSVV